MNIFPFPRSRSTSDDLQPMSHMDFRLLRPVGTGSFAKVWLSRSKIDGKHYALKVIRKTTNRAQTNALKAFHRELTNLKRFDPDFPFIAHLRGEFSMEDSFFMVLDYVAGGDLFEHLVKHGPVSELRAQLYVAEIGCALAYLRACGIIYRDLKSTNILIAHDGHLKLCDFGLSAISRERNYTICGTPHVLAPEIIRKENYDYLSDWYSFGVLLFEMLTGHPPFHQLPADSPALLHSILYRTIKIPKSFSRDCKDLLNLLLTKEPSQRIGSFEELMNHPWLSHFNIEDIKRKKITPEFFPSEYIPLGNSENFADLPLSGATETFV